MQHPPAEDFLMIYINPELVDTNYQAASLITAWRNSPNGDRMRRETPNGNPIYFKIARFLKLRIQYKFKQALSDPMNRTHM